MQTRKTTLAFALLVAAATVALVLLEAEPALGERASVAAAAAGVHKCAQKRPQKVEFNNTCCGGLICPYKKGVCCASGTHCCPEDMECLPVGIDNVQLCGFFNETKRQFERYLRETEVKRTPFRVNVTLEISNFMYAFYTKNDKWVRTLLRQDIIRDDTLGVEHVEILSVEAMRLPTEGTVAEERNWVDLQRAKMQEEAEKQASLREKKRQEELEKFIIKQRFAEVRFAPMSGIRVEALVFAEDDKDAYTLARSLFLLKDEGIWPLKNLETLPPEARANQGKSFKILPSSKVFYHDQEVSDKEGRKAVAQLKSEATKAASQVASVARRVFFVKQKLADTKKKDVSDLPFQKKNAQERADKLYKNHEKRVEDLKGEEYVSESVPQPGLPPVLPGPIPEVGKSELVPSM